METVGGRGASRRQERGGRVRKGKRESHFQAVRFGGFEESQIICYLWEIVKSVESVRGSLKRGREPGTAGQADECAEQLTELEKQMRRRVRIEMRRYFVRRRRRNVRILLGAFGVVACIVGIFGFLIGVDRVSGESMYPYLNHGDWIVYSRMGTEIQRGEVVVFMKNGENLVKRVAGVPGDTVEISESGNDVIVNGERIAERDITQTDAVRESSSAEREMTEKAGLTDGNQTSQPPFGKPLKMLDGQYMVLGDNRSVSIDSRDSRVGTVAQRDILGKVILVVRAR